MAATVVLALAGCSAAVRKGILEGYDHGGYASACGAAFLGFHGPVERCIED